MSQSSRRCFLFVVDVEGLMGCIFMSQGPRGLPGERGRPGASGAAVSVYVTPPSVHLSAVLLRSLCYDDRT